MKKILAKIVLFVIISTILNMPNLATAKITQGDSTDAEKAEESNHTPASDDTSSIEATTITELSKALSDVQEQPCIQEYIIKADGSDVEDGPDAGYIITIIQEPLDIKESRNKGDEFMQRRCYRNTFKYTVPTTGQESIAQELSRGGEGSIGCSKKGKKLLGKYKDSEFKAAFSCKEVQAILTKGGTSGIYGYIGMIYRWGASIAGIIAVTVIIFSGIQISASGGDSEAIGAGKKRILQSLAGIIVLFLSGLILYTINPNFFVR